MVEVNNTKPETIEFSKPKKVDPRNVCFWMEKEGILLGGQKNKVIKFLESNCVKPLGDGKYDILPIEGYNKTTHHVDWHKQSCTCQWYKKNGLECSHIKTIRTWLFMRNWNK